MVVLDEKTMLQNMSMPPPPPYYSRAQHPPPFPRRGPLMVFADLPPHLILNIVHFTFPQTPGIDEGRVERQRKTLYWLSTGLRLVNRAVYIACMHVLRSTYLPAYQSLIRPPCTSDPFPYNAPTPSSASTVFTLQRETQVLDLFIALKVREDVWADDTELHLERNESFRDLFDMMQPRARLEDLLRTYGTDAGVVAVPAQAPSYSSAPTTPVASKTHHNAIPGSSKGKGRAAVTPLPFAALSVSFSPRNVGVLLNSGGRRRTIVEVSRVKGEKLEASTEKLVDKLRAWLLAEYPI